MYLYTYIKAFSGDDVENMCGGAVSCRGWGRHIDEEGF
jgi:hypothetical protein